MAKGLADALEPLVRVLAHVQRPEVEAFEKVLLGARRVFVTGLGRTGLMARGFAMRLMHLGRRVYHVGDVITPAIRRGDLLVICSRTGRSPVLLYYGKIAQRVFDLRAMRSDDHNQFLRHRQKRLGSAARHRNAIEQPRLFRLPHAAGKSGG